MADVLGGFRVVLEREDGTLYTLSADAFRAVARCPQALLLTTCVERYNARMARVGLRERASIIPKARS